MSIYNIFLFEMEAREGDYTSASYIESEREVPEGKTFLKFNFEGNQIQINKVKGDKRESEYFVYLKKGPKSYIKIYFVSLTSLFKPEIPYQIIGVAKNAYFKGQLKGLLDEVYLNLAKKLGSLASDNYQYINARKLWVRLCRRTNVDYIDYRGNLISSGVKPKDFNDPDFWDDEQNNNFLIIR